MDNILEIYAKNYKMPSRQRQTVEKWLAYLKTVLETLML